MVVFNKTIIPLALVGYEMIIANSATCTHLVGYLSSHIQSALKGIIVNYKITEPLHALTLVDRCVEMRVHVCKHGCDILALQVF